VKRGPKADDVISAGDYRLLEPTAGQRIALELGCPTIKVGAALSDQVGVLEGDVAPGGGFQIPPWHEDFDEVFYVLEGEIEFLLDGHWRRAIAGSTVFVRAGTVHAFRNATARPARQLVVGPVEVAELIAELGEHPRRRWERSTSATAPATSNGRRA
jgi:uncharacterized cupin superfamily protein